MGSAAAGKELNTAENASYVASNLRPGMVLLAHDAGLSNRYIGIDAIPAIVRAAKDKGYEFVTASEMFAEQRRAAEPLVR